VFVACWRQPHRFPRIKTPAAGRARTTFQLAQRCEPALDRGSHGCELSGEMTIVFRSGDALMALGSDLCVDAWNEELESLTGIPAAEAIGRPCWEVLGGVDERGAVICHPGCPEAQLAREGLPIPSRRILIRTAEGRKPVTVTMSTIAAVNGNRGAVGLHLFRATPEGESEPAPESHLTARQHEVLELIAEGAPAKVIATRLGVAEVTVRNHIRAILLQLGCHSQLEALAEARRRRLLLP
jgi:DNA-binding CsgD family transcriptional regulator